MRSIFSVSEVFKDEFVLCVHAKSLSHGQLFATPRTVAHQAPVSVGFSRQEYWHGLPFPTPGDLPDPGVEPMSLAWRIPQTEEPGGPQSGGRKESDMTEH